MKHPKPKAKVPTRLCIRKACGHYSPGAVKVCSFNCKLLMEQEEAEELRAVLARHRVHSTDIDTLVGILDSGKSRSIALVRVIKLILDRMPKV